MKRVLVLILCFVLLLSACNFSIDESSVTESTASVTSDVIDTSSVQNQNTTEYPIIVYSDYADSLVLIGAYRTDEGFVDVTKYNFGELSHKELSSYEYRFGDTKPSLQNSLISVGDELTIFGKADSTKATCTDLDVTYFRDTFAIIKVVTDNGDVAEDSYAVVSEQQNNEICFVADDNEIFCDINSDGIEEKIWCTTEQVNETTVCYKVNVETNERVYTHEIEDLKPQRYSYRVIGIYDFDNDKELEILTYVNGLEDQYYILKLEEATLKEKMSVWLSD